MSRPREIKTAQLTRSSNGLHIKKLSAGFSEGKTKLLTRGPSLAALGFAANISLLAAAGAVSLASINSLLPLLPLKDKIKHPPPMPLETGESTW